MRSGICYAAILMVALAASAQAYDWTTNPGDGSPDNPYQIAAPEHLMAIGDNAALLDKHFVLMNNIVFDPDTNPAHVFTQALIAPYLGTGSPAFSGFFDGRGHQIENLKITSDGANVGLFGNIRGSGYNQVLVRGLTLLNPIISGPQRSGALAGMTEQCTLESTHVIGGTVSYPGGFLQGGLVGANFYTVIRDCTSSAQVSGNGMIGGLAGSNNSSALINCSATGNVTGSGSTVGGLVGNVQSWINPELIAHEEIVHCFAAGQVHADGDQCGGLIGFIKTGLVHASYASGTVTGNSKVGGLIGYVAKEVTNQTPSFSGPTTINGCFAAGSVQGQGNDIGGLVGRCEAVLVKDCYARGNTSSTAGGSVGGLIGLNIIRDNIVRCFSTGRATGVSLSGGLIGNYGGWVFLSFWDTQSSQLSQSDGGTGKTTAQMMSPETYRGWGDAVWVLNAGHDYPHLAWENNPGEPIVDEKSYSGCGTAFDPYQISTAGDLINAGFCPQDWDKYFVLTNDIVLDPANQNDLNVLYPNANFNRLGFGGLPFSGHFNGNFYSIAYPRHQNTGAAYNGLFGFLRGDGPDDVLVENLRIIHPVLAGNYAHGGLAGWLKDGKIARCGVEDCTLSLMGEYALDSANYFGGLVGYAKNANVTACYAEGVFDLGSRTMGGYGQGGLIGRVTDSTVHDSYAIGTFHSAGGWDGGFVGESWSSTMARCYAVPSVTSYTSIAGFVGNYSSSSFIRCYNRSGSGITTRGALPISESQMKQRTSFIGWDFLGESANGVNEIWRMCADGVDYPRLSWEFARSGDVACVDGVDMADLAALAAHWLTSAQLEPAAFNRAVDANGDEQIDLADFDVLAENWPAP